MSLVYLHVLFISLVIALVISYKYLLVEQLGLLHTLERINMALGIDSQCICT